MSLRQDTTSRGTSGYIPEILDTVALQVVVAGGEIGIACDWFPRPRLRPAHLGGVFLWGGGGRVGAGRP